MTGNVYLTGDTHGSFKRVKLFCKMNELTEDDVVVILGDAGLNYYLADRDKHGKKLLERLPPRFLCVRGNHEERPYSLLQYHETEAFGGTSCLVIDGANSVDKGYRIQKQAERLRIMSYDWCRL